MASAFQRGAFQTNAFQMDAGVAPVTPRGFDFEDTLRAFAKERRRKREELEVEGLMRAEDALIIKAIKRFLGGTDAT